MSDVPTKKDVFDDLRDFEPLTETAAYWVDVIAEEYGCKRTAKLRLHVAAYFAQRKEQWEYDEYDGLDRYTFGKRFVIVDTGLPGKDRWALYGANRRVFDVISHHAKLADAKRAAAKNRAY
jgi:hypothetical protein